MIPPRGLSQSDSEFSHSFVLLLTGQSIRTGIGGRPFLLYGDVNAHDISRAASARCRRRNVDAGSSRPSCNMPRLCSAFFKNEQHQLFQLFIMFFFFFYCMIKSLLLVIMLLDASALVVSRISAMFDHPGPAPSSCLWFVAISCCSCDGYSQGDTSPTLHRNVQLTGPFRDFWWVQEEAANIGIKVHHASFKSHHPLWYSWVTCL